MRRFRNWLRRTARSEDGTATLPFVIFLPFFLTMIVSSVELGMYMVRSVMLERGLDMAVRELRLGNWKNPDADGLRKRICNNALIMQNCAQNLLIEQRVVSKTTWEPLSSGPTCIDHSSLAMAPADHFEAGVSNDIMLLRVCLKVNPVFTTRPFGLKMGAIDGAGQYALVSVAAFVNEPRLGGS